jgi:hypothetical protein
LAIPKSSKLPCFTKIKGKIAPVQHVRPALAFHAQLRQACPQEIEKSCQVWLHYRSTSFSFITMDDGKFFFLS